MLLFLQDNLPEDKQLVEDVIEFLNFKANSFAGNAYSDEDPRFAGLSEAEQAELVSQAADTRIKLVPYVRPKLDVTEWDTMVLRDGDCVVCACATPVLAQTLTNEYWLREAKAVVAAQSTRQSATRPRGTMAAPWPRATSASRPSSTPPPSAPLSSPRMAAAPSRRCGCRIRYGSSDGSVVDSVGGRGRTGVS